MLEKQVISLPFAGGMSTRVDPKSVPATQLLELENATFERPGSLRKRNGYRRLSTQTSAGTELTSGQALFRYEDELLVTDDASLYSYDDGSDRWVPKGVLPNLSVSQRHVAQQVEDLTSQASATHPGSGLSLFAYEGDGGLTYSVLDSQTGQVLVINRVLDADGIKPSVVALDGALAVYWVNTVSTQVFVALLPTTDPTKTLSGDPITNPGFTSDPFSLSSSAPNYDVVAIPESDGEVAKVYLFHNNTKGTGTIWYFKPNSTGVVVPAQKIENASNSTGAVCVFPATEYAWPAVCWTDGADLLNAIFDTEPDNAGTPDYIRAIGTIETLSDPAKFSAVTGTWETPTETGATYQVRVWHTVLETDRSNCVTRTAATDSTSGWVTGEFNRSTFVASQALSRGGDSYVMLGHESDLQPTFFLFNGSGTVCGKVYPGTAAHSFTRASGGAVQLPRPSQIDASTWRLALRDKRITNTQSGRIYTAANVSSVDLSFGASSLSFQSTEAARNLHIAGGLLWMYDGQAPVEHGFLLVPEDVEATTTAVGTTYAYNYVATYEWTDGRGQRHISGTSVPVEITSANEAPSAGLQVTVPGLRISEKPAGDITIGLYRTENNGTVYHRVNGFTNTAAGADSITLNDSLSDATLVGRPLLYTTGNILPNTPFLPATDHVAVHRNRVWIVDAEEPTRLFYSKTITTGVPVEFAGALQLDVDPSGGPVTALASLDDALVVFKRDKIFLVTGDGPDNTGAFNRFSDALLLTVDVGCSNANSISTMPSGLVFQTLKGIYLLNRGRVLEFVGEGVDGILSPLPSDRYAFNEASIVSSTLEVDTDQVRFCTDDGFALVYDYGAGQWSKFTNVAGVDSEVWKDRHAYLRTDGTVMVEVPGVFDDDGSYVSLRLRTAWFQFGGMQFFQRVRRAFVLGDLVENHRLQVSVCVNFDQNPVQVQTIDVSASGPYNEGDYGDGNYGGDFPDYQYKVHMVRQKSDAVQLVIEDVSPSTGSGAGGMNLSGLAFELGLKSGVRKLPASKTLTTAT